MTPEELELLVVGKDSFEHFRKAFSDLSDAERRNLSKTAQKLFRDIHRSSNAWDFETAKGASNRLNELLKKAHNESVKKTATGHIFTRPDWVDSLQKRATLALVAVAPISALKSDTVWFRSIEDQVFQIVQDRKPDWLGEWIEHLIAAEWPRVSFPFVVKLLENDLIPKPEIDNYISSYANWLMRTTNGRNDKRRVPPISQQLKSSPLLMEDVYRVFAVESNAFNTNGWLRKGAELDYETWTEALLKMVEDGTLDRKRVLEESLAALTADLKSNQLSGITKFHKQLRASPAELKANEENYRELFASPVGPVARFGLDQLAVLYKAKNLDLGLFLNDLPTLFSLPVKSHPVAAIKLLGRMAKSDPKSIEDILGALLPALNHENVDVQTIAIEMFELHSEKLSPQLREDIASNSQFISPHLTSRLSSLSGKDNAEAEAFVEDLNDSLEVLKNTSDSDRVSWGLDLLSEKPFTYRPITSDIMQLRVLHTVAPIEPIQTQDELLSAIATYIEMPLDKTEAERIADGIARIPRIEDADFQARIIPLMHRLGMSEDAEYEVAPGGRQFANLVKTYLSLKFKSNIVDSASDWYSESQRRKLREVAPMQTHFRFLTSLIAKGSTPGRLCAPTHENGWICPLTWVDRLSVVQNRHDIDDIDLSYSLLRLAPDNRLEAAAKTLMLSGRFRDLAAFVLGADETPNISRSLKIEVWMSAARARNPLKDWSEAFAHLNLSSNVVGSISPRSLGWKTENAKIYEDRIVFENTILEPPKKRLFKRVVSVNEKRLPTGMLGQHPIRKRYHYEDVTAEERQWRATLFPLYPAMSYRSAIRGMISRIDTKSNSFEPVHGAMNALFQKNRPWSEMAYLVLCLALFGRDADAQRLSIDALVEGIDSGQLDPERFVSILERLSRTDWVKLNRPGPAMLQVAQVSPLHAYIIADVLSKWLPKLETKRRALGDLLDVSLQSMALANSGVRPVFRVYLESFNGSSKAAKVAKSILKLPDVSTEDRSDLRSMAIRSRLRYVYSM